MQSEVTIDLDPNSAASYRLFLEAKRLPSYRVIGRTVVIPAEYAARLGGVAAKGEIAAYEPWPGLFDYQRDISRLAIERERFAVFADCGLGKTLILSEFARHALATMPRDKAALIVSPLMVIPQTIDELSRWYGDELPIARVKAADLDSWLASGDGRLGITNYDALKGDIGPGRLGALILDESSMLKSQYGKFGQEAIRLGKGLRWKLALSGTPAPNDRIEYGNHAVFLDAFPTLKSFLAKFFVNRGQTDERWEMKPHAIGPFYRALSHWSIFLNDPATYGWRDNVATLPPIRVHIHDVELTGDQNAKIRDMTGNLFSCDPGGIGSRSKLARVAKSGDSLKPAFIRSLVDSWPDESTLIWCRFNDEQDRLAAEMPDAASLSGSTGDADRRRMIDDFKSGRIRTLISKPKILGFGLNLQVATRQIFSSLHDSYEEYYQAVKRSNRVGSTRPLHVHVPLTEAERPMAENVIRKANRVQQDTAEQELIFKEMSHGFR